MNTVAEEWRPIPGHSDYEVSSIGSVRNVNRPMKPLKGSRTIDGYMRITLSRNGKDYARLVHRLVMLAWHGESSDLQVNHINGIKTDNRVENLEYATAKQNITHAWDTGLMKRYGEDNPRAKITEFDVRTIREIGATERAVDVGLRYGISRAQVQRIRNHQNWKTVT